MASPADLMARRAGIEDAAGAETLVADLLATVDELATVLVAEARHLAAGRVREGLARQDRKGELASAYLRGSEAAKANAVALARHLPGGLAALSQAQLRLQLAAARNQAVLETARAVSEGLVKSLASEVARLSRPSTYAVGGMVAARPSAAPLMFSASL